MPARDFVRVRVSPLPAGTRFKAEAKALSLLHGDPEDTARIVWSECGSPAPSLITVEFLEQKRETICYRVDADGAWPAVAK